MLSEVIKQPCLVETLHKQPVDLLLYLGPVTFLNRRLRSLLRGLPALHLVAPAC